MNPINKEVVKWQEKINKEGESFDFIQLDFLVDMREAQKRYKEEYKNDIGSIKTFQISFNQWPDLKKYESLKFHVKCNDYNLD